MKTLTALLIAVSLFLSGCVTYVTGEKAKVTITATTAIELKWLPLPPL